MAEATCADQPDSSWPKVIGIASIRWVRPVFGVLRSSRARLSIAFFRCFSAGSNCSLAVSVALTWIAVGITSFELCP